MDSRRSDSVLRQFISANWECKRMEIFVLALVLLLGLSLAFKVGAANERTRRAGQVASSLDLEGAHQRLQRALPYIFDYFTDPGSPVSKSVAYNELEMAVACADRINQLQGFEYGP